MFKAIRSHLLFVMLVVASWYNHPGRVTANGEMYNQEALTAAHRTLPFNSLVLVIREDTGEEVVVRINDRGPFIKGREIDLSLAAAKKLNMVEKGLVKVSIKVISEGSRNGSAAVR
jgi:rare lipoprotein A